MILIKNKYLFIISAALIALLVFYWQSKVKHRGINEFQTFYTSNIHGKIIYLSPNVGVVYFKVLGDSLKYAFIPTSAHEGKQVFSSLASKGDVVSKPAFADTLTLNTEGKIYYFTFKKLNKQQSD